MPKETEMPAVDWRQAAEEIGRQAFETAVAPEPEPTPPPWWEFTEKRKGITMKNAQTKQTATPPPAAAPVLAQPPAPEVEDWVSDTPSETLYQLEMWQQETIESIDMTRREYVSVKRHLAGLRGIAPAAAEPATEPAAVPQTTLEPMKVSLSELSPEQEREVRAALLSRLQQQLAGMETCQIQSITWYADVVEADHGCDTPAQDFITTLVLHNYVRPLIPDNAARLLEEFRENFDSMVEGARAFTARYPKAFETATAA